MVAALVWLFFSQTSPPLVIDFTQPTQAKKWRAQNDIKKLEPTRDGLLIQILGDDPYLGGPLITPPKGNLPLLGTIRLKSATGGTGQLFYFSARGGPVEANSVRFEVPAGIWHDARIRLPVLSGPTRFRLDPPGNGDCTLATITLEPREDIQAPTWPEFRENNLAATLTHTLQNGPSRLLVGQGWDNWALHLGETKLARGHAAGMAGYQVTRDGRTTVEWIPLGSQEFSTKKLPDGSILTEGTFKDPDGCTWRARRVMRPGKAESFEFDFQMTVNQTRNLVWFPALMAVAGKVNTQGKLETRKKQALLSGVEYLDDEPSSSQADITGPAHQRRVPDPVKLTMPLMAWQSGEEWVSVSWEENASWTPFFDTPDRTLGTGGHLLGMILPGAEPGVRGDGDLFPYSGVPINPGSPITLKATLRAGKGSNITRAVQKHLQDKSLPSLPKLPEKETYARLAIQGWLDSGLADGNGFFRHAVMGNLMGPQPASDAPWMLEWLSNQVGDPNMRQRARDAAKIAWSRLDNNSKYHAHVGHLREPVAPFLGNEGVLASASSQATGRANALLKRFEPDGSIVYRDKHKADLARTQPSRQANGLTGRVVVDLIQAAILSGDADLMEKALARLASLDAFENTVPRGAQTWEVPLHTPDILASAHLLEAYRLGFELTGDKKLLAKALDWAWTGVPFVYLRQPTGGPVGPYATVAVLGATHYEAPVWIGLPVQWCGLVYADAVSRLARHDPEGPWEKLAGGITASAMQQVYPPQSERRGLLPDSFSLRSQIRNPADINPGTLQPLAMRVLETSWTFDTLGIPGTSGKSWATGPGRFEILESKDKAVVIRFHPWRKGEPSRLLLAGDKWRETAIEPLPRQKVTLQGQSKGLHLEIDQPTTLRLQP